MIGRKMLTAALVAVGLFASLEYKSVAQSTQSTPSTTGQNQTQLSAADKQFITAAAQGGMAEVQMAQLATKQASSEAVRKYAKQMIQDHTRANKELMAIATKKGVTPPKTIGPKYEAVRAKLAKLSGKEFDQAYMQEAGVKAHAEQEALFQRQSQQGQDPQLQAFATKTLPIVRHHLQMAQKMTGSTSPTTTSPSSSPMTSPSPSPSPSP